MLIKILIIDDAGNVHGLEGSAIVFGLVTHDGHEQRVSAGVLGKLTKRGLNMVVRNIDATVKQSRERMLEEDAERGAETQKIIAYRDID